MKYAVALLTLCGIIIGTGVSNSLQSPQHSWADYRAAYERWRRAIDANPVLGEPGWVGADSGPAELRNAVGDLLSIGPNLTPFLVEEMKNEKDHLRQLKTSSPAMLVNEASQEITQKGRMTTVRIPIHFGMTLLLVTFALGHQDDPSFPKQSRDEILARQVTMPASETIQSAFAHLLVDAHVAGGIVASSSCQRDEEHDFGGAKTSLGNALDMIVSSQPENKWLITGGVVNLIPAGKLPALLSTPISDFKVQDARTVVEALDQLMALPEVRDRIAQLHLEELSRHIGLSDLKRPGSTAEDKPALNLNRRNVTLRVALNVIASAHGYAVWAYTERQCNGRDQFRIDFLVR